jgi:hypothetical protein
MSLGFVIAPGPDRCAPTWSGYVADPAWGPYAYESADVAGLRAAGGAPVISFGGEDGTELAHACTAPGALIAAYGSVIDAYAPTRVARLDFDVEGAALGDTAANTRRAEVVAYLQRALAAVHRRLVVSFTLPADPTGLPRSSVAVIANAIAHRVRIAYVNLMTMDFGSQLAPHPAGRMAAYSIDAALNTVRQLAALFPHRSPAAITRMIGLTPMIGVNDDRTEVFTLTDARRLAAYARRARLGMLSMWQLERDLPCGRPERYAQTSCSGVAQRPFQFARALAG